MTRIITKVKAGDNLQAALNAANPGDTLSLEAGATFTGNFRLPVKPGAETITIRSSAACDLEKGRRVQPGDAACMARIVSPNVMAAIATVPGSHHWRLVALDCTVVPGVYSGGVLRLSGGEERLEEDMPHHIEVDQCYVHGDPRFGGKRGIAPNCNDFSITNCYISDFMSDSQDAQAICCWQAARGEILNNYIEGSGENLFFAELSMIPGVWPTDILVQGNHLAKPLRWMTELSPRPLKWVVKNVFEIKSGIRITVRGNVLENCWVSGQAGGLVNLKAGAAPNVNPSRTEDILFELNLVRGGLYGMQISGSEPRNDSPIHKPGPGALKRVTVRHNAFIHLGGAPWGGVARGFQIVQSPSADVTIENNTLIGASVNSAITSDAIASPGFIFRSNLVRNGTYGVKGTSTATGTASIDKAWPERTWENNVFLHPTDLTAQYPAGTRFVTEIALGVDGYTQTEYPGVGVDAAALTAAIAGVVQP